MMNETHKKEIKVASFRDARWQKKSLYVFVDVEGCGVNISQLYYYR